MNIIRKLTICYMRKNKRRTIATIVGIIGAMMIITGAGIFFDSFLAMSKEQVGAEEGSYQMIYHGLSKEQYEELRNSSKVKSCIPATHCIEHEQGETFCAEVEMKRVGLLVYSSSQKLAESIGMTPLPKEEQYTLPTRKNLGGGYEVAEYAVTYHQEILDFYRVSTHSGVSLRLLLDLALLLLAVMSCILIYNAYAISVFEKLKYLGILGSVGASRRQKALVVYWEGILEGLIGIPVGITLGIFLCTGMLKVVENYIFYNQCVSMVITAGGIFSLTLVGALMIYLACFFPARRAQEASSMDLIVRQYTIDEGIQKRTDLLKDHKVIGTEGALAMKNVWVKRRNYIVNGVVLIVALCMLLDGAVYLRSANGDYAPVDGRERPALELWSELYTNDNEKIRKFYEELSQISQIQNVSLERTLDMDGMILEKGAVKPELDGMLVKSHYAFEESFGKAADELGNEVEGYRIWPYIIGLDDVTFESYVKKAGYKVAEGDGYQVLIDDYIPVQGIEEDAEVTRQNILAVQPGETLSFTYSRYGDLNPSYQGLASRDMGKYNELMQGEFEVIGTTAEAPPYPYYSGTEEDIDGSQGLFLGVVRMYMSMDDFEQLLADDAYKNTYGMSPENTSLLSPRGYRTIPTYVKFDILRKKQSGEGSFLDEVLQNEGLANRIQEDKEIEKVIAAAVRDSGLTEEQGGELITADEASRLEDDTYSFGSRAIWEGEYYFRSQDFLMRMLGYGAVILIILLSITNIFQNISMSMRLRKGEFAAYRSMGMAVKSLRKMLMFENSMYGAIACIVGIPFSLWVLDGIYKEMKLWEGGLLVWHMPWDMIVAQIVVAVILVVVPVVHSIRQLRHLNIIESIRNVNT